ncbi:MAG: universal stress protein, partial [Candidatus Rokubacteria bacterium]|nr:universal stress protein [Candidatus Rokubacteria bacterium]
MDNSEHANRAIELAVELAGACGAKLTGVHVYAGGLHDTRFKQMEYTLPARYRQETELERQRAVHDSLIRMGLRLIADSYLDAMAGRAAAAGLTLERKTFDGKHHRVLLEDARRAGYDLVVLGALGMGAVKDSLLGSVAERVVRGTAADTLVVKTLDPAAAGRGAIVVGLDGSAQAFHGLRLGLALGRALGHPVEAVAVYDPYLHYTLFKSLVGVLSAEAAQVFRFAEQEALHEEIIDSGLARIYQTHLDTGRRLAAAEGGTLTTTLLAGKCFEKLLQHCRASQPWLLILGRAGAHSDEAEGALGSNSETLVRLAPCNVLLTGGRFTPPQELLAEETVAWTAEAEARMAAVPRPVQGVARAAVLRYATEQGHTVVTSSVIDAAMAHGMPGRGPAQLRAMALGVAAAAIRARGAEATAVCGTCGYAARGPEPAVTCPVCGGGADRFRVIDAAALEAAAARQGGAQVEEPLPGIAVRWAAEARAALGRIPDAALRRLAQARVEKHARSRRLPVITLEAALPLIEETGGREGGTPAPPAGGEAPPQRLHPAAAEVAGPEVAAAPAVA